MPPPMYPNICDKLTDAQKQAVSHVFGPILVIAGPGSGKTRVITCRIAALIDAGVRPHNICAVTFTNKAAEEMRQRVELLERPPGAHISTFHSLCARILRQYAQYANLEPGFSIYGQAEQTGCMKQAVKDCSLDTANFSPARMLDAVSALKNRLINVDAFHAQAEDFFSKNLARIYARYQQILAANNALDFDDLLLKTAFLLEKNADVCARLNERFKFLLIDEYQDTNHAQYRIARALVSAHNNICATGDPDQSIYRWRGADISNILAFEKDWPDAVVVKLEENFRSSAGLLALADRLIAFNRKRKPKKLIAVRPAGNPPQISSHEDEIVEARAVADQIAALLDQGASAKDIAVFYRVNAASRVLEEAFFSKRIPYQIVRGLEFYNRKEIRDLLAYLKVLANPSDEVALLRIINTPPRGIGKTTIDRLRDCAASSKISLYQTISSASRIDSIGRSAKDSLAGLVQLFKKFKDSLTQKSFSSVALLVENIFIESGLKEHLRQSSSNPTEALENVGELINAAAQYDRQTENPTLADFLQQISLFSDTDRYDPAAARVALMTLHSAKGLEFEHVFIVGLEDGLLPHQRSTDDPDELEEERRLFFVGMTRAKTGLYISLARYRTIYGQVMRTIPSQFLFEIGYTPQQPDTSQAALLDSQLPDRHFPPGLRVKHKIFGHGIIKEFVDMGENSIVVVRFKSGQTKTLMLKYAGLTSVDEF